MIAAMMAASRRRGGGASGGGTSGGVVSANPDAAVPYAFTTPANGYYPFRAPQPAITPTPDGTGVAVHPSVLDFGPNGWHGWRFWMMMTPWYQQNDPLENPCVLVSQDGYAWQVPTGVTNPIYPWPGTYWQSDPDLAYDPDADQLVLIFRHRYQPRIGRSSDGVTWSAAVPFDWPGGVAEQVSPCLLRLGPNDWRCWTSTASGTKSAALNMWTATAPEGPWSGPTVCTGDLADGELWHMDVVRRPSDGVFLMVLATSSDAARIKLASSLDGIKWTRRATEINGPGSGGWDNGRLYRPTFTLHENGTTVRYWYSGENDAATGAVAGTTWRIGYAQFPTSLFPTPIA